MFKHFQQQLNTHFPHHCRFLIGFSGGLDSTVLVHLFSNLRQQQPHLQLRVIHIHHGLSPNADHWQEHCAKISRLLHLPFLTEKVQIASQVNLEACARNARYQAVQRHLLKDEIFVTAHHQQDQTENVFLALKRGSGLLGLAAMPTVNRLFNMTVFRPLLSFDRSTILSYAQHHALTWIEDESNQDNRYERNFLRNDILPILRQRWQAFDQTVARSARHCLQQQQLIEELLSTEFQRNFDKIHRTFALDHFDNYSPLKQNALLRMWFSELGVMMPSETQLTCLVREVVYAKQDRNPVYQLNQYAVRRFRKKLFLTPNYADLSACRYPLSPNQTLSLPDQLGSISLHDRSSNYFFQWHHGDTVYQHHLPVSTMPIEIRFSYSGKIRLKNNINQEIKKLWQKNHIPVWQRHRIPLIFYGETLMCIAGLWQNVFNEYENEKIKENKK